MKHSKQKNKTPKVKIISDSQYKLPEITEEEFKFRRKKHILSANKYFDPYYKLNLSSLYNELNRKDETKSYSTNTETIPEINIDIKNVDEKVRRSFSMYENTDYWKPKTIEYGRNFPVLEKGQDYPDVQSESTLSEIKAESEFKPIPIKGEKERQHYRKVLALIIYLERIRSSDPGEVTVLPIAQTQKSIVRLFGSQQNVSGVIRFAKEIGLLKVQNENYVFVSETTRYKEWWSENTFSKEYFYFKNVEDKIRQFCRYHNILPWTKKDNKKAAVFDLPEWIKPKLVISSNITGVKKPEDMSQNEFIESVKAVLIEKYPIYNEIKEKVDAINSTRFYQKHPEIQLIAEFNLTIKKNHLKKIGFRITNKACNIPKNERSISIAKRNSSYYCYSNREQMLKSLGLDGSNYDVKSSIPRVMYLLSHGEWLSEDIDIYKLIYDKMCENDKNFKNSYPVFTETLRSLYKQLFMTVNFTKDEMTASNSIYRKYLKPKNEDDKRKLEYVKEEENEIFQKALINNKHSILNFVHAYNEAIQQVIGFTSSSEIFLHESAIYLNVLKRLTDYNVPAFQCYDAIYTSNSNISENTFKRIIREESEKYYSQYKESITFSQLMLLEKKQKVTIDYDSRNKSFTYTNPNKVTFMFSNEDFIQSLVDLMLVHNNINYYFKVNSICNNSSIYVNIESTKSEVRVKLNSSTKVLPDKVYEMIENMKDKRKKCMIMGIIEIIEKDLTDNTLRNTNNIAA